MFIGLEGSLSTRVVAFGGLPRGGTSPRQRLTYLTELYHALDLSVRHDADRKAARVISTDLCEAYS